MSLSGNLSDLSLADLLQVVALSRKTGTLEICSDRRGAAWLGLRDGGIVRVARDDGSAEREKLLETAGLDDAADPDAVAATLWDGAVHALLEIFEWIEGEFTFDPSADPSSQWRGPDGILLPSPLSPEFLALEGARLEDQEARGEDPVGAQSADETADSFLREARAGDETDFSDVQVSESAEIPAPAEALALADAEPIAAEPLADAPPAVICVAPDLAWLEAVKASLTGEFPNVHIFQDPASALTRLKQYMLRAEFPALVLTPAVHDPVEPRKAQGWRRFSERIRELSPRVRVLVVSDEAVSVPAGVRVWSEPDTPASDSRRWHGLIDAICRD